MIDTDKYEDAKKMVQDAGLIDENDGHPDIHYRKIAHLLEEVKRLRIIETAAQLYGDYCKERHHQIDDVPFSFERWLDWMLVDDELGKMMIHYDQEALDDMKSKATYYSPKGCGFFTDYSKLKEMIE